MAPDVQPGPGSGQKAARDPIAVIRPYMVDLDPKVRANAAAALAVISVDYPAAGAALLDMLIAEKDNAIIDRMEREIAALGPAAREAVSTRLTALEHDDSPERRALARYCRGRLRLLQTGAGDPAFLDAAIALTAESSRGAHDVRAAEALLAGLDGSELAGAAVLLRHRLHSDNGWTRDRTYALLGRLRTAGSPLGRYRTLHPDVWRMPRTWSDLRRLAEDVRARFWVTGAVARDDSARQARRFSVTFVWTVTAWAAVGACLLSIHLAATLEVEPPASFYAIYVLAVLVSSLALAVPAVRRVSPIAMHYDRGAAMLQQALVAAVWVFGPALAGVGVLLASISFSNRLESWVAALVTAPLSISAFVAGIRIGTILGYNLLGREIVVDGTSMRRFWHSRRIAGLLQTLVGASCGVLITAVLLWLSRRLHVHGQVDEVSRLIEGLWVFLTPTSAAVAAAFSSVDRFSASLAEEPEPGRSPDVRWSVIQRPAELYRTVRTVVTPRRIVGGALLVPLVLALGLIVHDLRNRRPRIEMALPGQTATASQAITEIPTRRDFRAAFPQRIAATLTQPPTTSAGSSAELTMVLREWTPSGKTAGDAPDCTRRSTPRVLISTDSGKLSRFLGWGCYSLEVSSQDQVGGVGRFSSVAYVLDARGMQAAGLPLGAEIPGREDMEAQFTLRLALNTDSAPSTADAAFAGNSTVAVLTRVPDEQTLIVRNPAAVLITATPPILRSNESRASGRAPSEADDSSDPDASDRSMRQGDETLQLELFRGAEILAQGQTASPTIRQVLQPGEYTVKVGRHKDSKSDAPIEHPVAVNVLSVRRPDPGPAVSSRNRPDLEWSIPDVLPASYDFDVPVRQTVAVEIPAVAGWTPFTASASRRIRYILDLRAIEKGEPSATALARVSTSTDRDQIVQREFDPGRYRCTVSAIGSAMADLVPMSPPRVTISFLGRGTGTAAAGK